MKNNETKEIEVINGDLISARVPKDIKEFLVNWGSKMHRSMTAQLINLIEKLKGGKIEAIKYELRNIGIEIKDDEKE